MNAPVPILQEPTELARLVKLVREIRPRRILEVGSLYGGTLWHWMTEFPGAVILSIDMVAVGVPEHPLDTIIACRRLWPEWARTNACTLRTYQGKSSNPEAIEAAQNTAPFDFIFIDGGHHYDEINADFENFWPMLRTGGIMAFHDCATADNSPGIDCGRWWREIEREAFQTKLINITPGQWGIGVIRK